MSRLGTYISGALGLAGTTMAAAGFGRDVDLLAVGVSVSLAGFVGVVASCLLASLRCGQDRIAAAHRPAEEAYELGHQVGYDKGYLDGRRVARPVVVPFAGCRRCKETARAIPAQAPLGEVPGDRLPPEREEALILSDVEGRGARVGRSAGAQDQAGRLD